MAAITRDLRKLPVDARERVVNWLSTQTWSPPEHIYTASLTGEKQAE